MVFQSVGAKNADSLGKMTLKTRIIRRMYDECSGQSLVAACVTFLL